MRYLLDVAYLLLLLAVSPWLVYASWRYGKYRDGLGAKLGGNVPQLPSYRQRVWFHAVSVGEINLLESILERFQSHCPDAEVVISTTTRTGYELAKQKYSNHLVFYCPLDFSWAVRNAFSRMQPTLLVLVELELWPNLLGEAGRRNVPVAIINGRLSDKSYRGYRRIGHLLPGWLNSIQAVAAQSPMCAARFRALGIPADRVRDVGSVKFDGARTDRENERTAELVREAYIAPQDLVFIAGSTQAPEEAMAVKTYVELQTSFPSLRLIIVPRHPERAVEVARLLDDTGLSWNRRSRPRVDDEHARILLVDVIGELGHWWGRADIGFVGGSMGKRGGQNMIEPAAFGVATCFGPKTRNFRDVVQLLLSRAAAVVVSDQMELTSHVRRCAADIDYRRELGIRAMETVLQQTGAADRTVNMLAGLLHPRGATLPGTENYDASTQNKPRAGYRRTA